MIAARPRVLVAYPAGRRRLCAVVVSECPFCSTAPHLHRVAVEDLTGPQGAERPCPTTGKRYALAAGTVSVAGRAA